MSETAWSDSRPRRVVCAANKIGPHIILGARHWDPWMRKRAKELGLFSGFWRWAYWRRRAWGEVQGFIDNRGNFLTREEAWKVASAARQVIPDPKYRSSDPEHGILFSEDLY